jgi:shikimate dehydrogenase
VNTILCAGTCLVGENTDVFGFSEDLKQHVPESNPGQALVLGAGGGARAVVYALASQGWQVFVAARQPGQAQTLAASFAQLQPAPIPMTQGLPEAATDLGRLNVRLIVNATPLGMPPHDHSSPWPAEVQLPEGCFVYDLVYHPQETVLLRQAKARGLKCTNGLGMLVRQAAQAFTIWTNLPLECLPVVQEAMQHASVNGREY